MATKREHAVAILDALDSKARLRSRTFLGSAIAVVFFSLSLTPLFGIMQLEVC